MKTISQPLHRISAFETSKKGWNKETSKSKKWKEPDKLMRIALATCFFRIKSSRKSPEKPSLNQCLKRPNIGGRKSAKSTPSLVTSKMVQEPLFRAVYWLEWRKKLRKNSKWLKNWMMRKKAKTLKRDKEQFSRLNFSKKYNFLLTK